MMSLNASNSVRKHGSLWKPREHDLSEAGSWNQSQEQCPHLTSKSCVYFFGSKLLITLECKPWRSLPLTAQGLIHSTPSINRSSYLNRWVSKFWKEQFEITSQIMLRATVAYCQVESAGGRDTLIWERAGALLGDCKCPKGPGQNLRSIHSSWRWLDGLWMGQMLPQRLLL